MRNLLALFAALGLLFVPMPALAQFYTAERMLTATDLVQTAQLSRWVVSPKAENLMCVMDVTAISGASATVFLQVQGCLPENIVAGDCVDDTDDVKFYAGTGVTTVTKFYMLLSRQAATDVAAASFDLDVTGPLPPLWAVYANETGTTTVSYTVDCVWW